MAGRFSPDCSCCDGCKVLIYAEYEWFGQDYQELADLYSDEIGAENVTYVPLGESLPVGFSLSNYGLVIMPGNTNADAALSSANIGDWLASGNKRLVMAGDWQLDDDDPTSVFANTYMDDLGLAMRCDLRVVISYGDCEDDIVPFESHYLTDGLIDPNLYFCASTTVSGGTPLAIGVLPGEDPILAIEEIDGSEVLLSGDTNMFGGEFPEAPDLNSEFLLRLYPC